MRFRSIYRLFFVGTLSILIFYVLIELSYNPVPSKTKFNYAKQPVITAEQRRLIAKYIHRFHLFPHKPEYRTLYPASATGDSIKNSSFLNTVLQHLDSKTNGFFVEYKAFDGIRNSDTLPFEKYFNWTGLLLESNPVDAVKLREMNRRAWVADFCLSTLNYPVKALMKYFDEEALKDRSYDVRCFPLDFVLQALNCTQVDYLSLKGSNVELDILRTIPFRKIKIHAISVDANFAYRRMIKTLLQALGYKYVKTNNVNKSLFLRNPSVKKTNSTKATQVASGYTETLNHINSNI